MPNKKVLISKESKDLLLLLKFKRQALLCTSDDQ